jgi:hypothetical protein
MKRVLLASAMLGLAACSSMPSVFGGDSAYKEEMVSANRYKVTYTSPEKATKTLIADRTLARAAQLTLDKGNEWFEIAGKVDIENGQTLVIVPALPPRPGSYERGDHGPGNSHRLRLGNTLHRRQRRRASD